MSNITTRLNYDRDVKPLVNKLQKPFEEAKGSKLQMRSTNDKWYIYRVRHYGQDELCSGTLRECYCFLLGMEEILI